MKTNNKLDKAYKTISEVAEILDLKNKRNGKLSTHTIRFWEKTFKQVKPKFLNSKTRYFDKSSIEILKKIKFLLKDQGFKIEGVKKILNNELTFNLDDSAKKSISYNDRSFKLKLNKISNIIKDIKNLK